MANWAWPHTPASNLARLLLVGGPFSGEQAGFLPSDTPAPAQIVWAGFVLGRFTAYLYEWHGERRMDQGRTDALIYTRATPCRTISPDEIPPAMTDAAELWANGADMLARLAFNVPPEMIWPGL